jgi:hypothetical protein
LEVHESKFTIRKLELRPIGAVEAAPTAAGEGGKPVSGQAAER